MTAAIHRASCLALLLLLSLAVSTGGSRPEPGSAIEIDHAEVLEAGGSRPPSTSPASPAGPAARAWQPVSLPDRRTPDGSETAQVWYRASVHLDAPPDELFAVYLPALRMNAAVFVNGQLIGDGGRFHEPVARNWNRPLYFTVPAGLWRAGENRVHVRLAASPSSQLRLQPFRVGADRVLRPEYEQRTLVQITLRELAVAVIVAACVAVVFVGLRRSESRYTLWFAASLGFVAFGQLDAILRDIPLPTRVWQWANMVAYLSSAVCLIPGVHQILRIRAPRVEAGFAALAASLSVVAALVPASRFVPVVTAILFSVSGVMAYVVVQVLRRGPRRQARLVTVFALTLLAVGAHDVWALLAGSAIVPVRLVTYVPVVAALFACGLVIVNLIDALHESQRLNRELDRRVAEKHAELAESYERMRGLEREQASASERERIMREMHDGVGGVLVSTLAMVEAGERDGARLSGALREALDGMRLVLDSLDPAEDDLLAVLANMRTRIQPRLAAHGIEIDWQVAPTQPLPGLTPKVVLHVLRIVQEAIHNTIRHADAKTIAVRSGEARRDGRDGVFLEIRDDGRGLREQGGAGHRGLANMRRRAGEIGAELQLEGWPDGPGPANEKGTRVCLWLPLDPESEAP